MALGCALEFFKDLFQPLLEIASDSAAPTASHVEREHVDVAILRTSLSTMRLPGLRQFGLATPASPTNNGLFFCGAQHLDRTMISNCARSPDRSCRRAPSVEVHAVSLERLALLLGILVAFGLGLFVDTAHGRASTPRAACDAWLM